MVVPSLRSRPDGRFLALALAVVAILAPLAAACGSSSPAGAGGHGTASVACAGSLEKLYNETVGPAFEKATGDRFGGPPCNGSSTLATEIKAGEISPGAFLAVGSSAIESLFPTRAKYAIVLATDPLVVAYSRKSRFYSQLNAIKAGRKPLSDLFPLLETPGFKLGRTDPTQDPQGIFFILMVKLATAELRLPPSTPAKVLGITSADSSGAKSQIFAEDPLPTDIASGIVDAGSAYLSEALQYHLDYIRLPPALDFATPADSSKYASVSIVVDGAKTPGGLVTLDETTIVSNGAAGSPADSAADKAFVAYMLSSAGRQVLAKAGYSLQKPTVVLASRGTSPRSVLPASVEKAFTALGGTVAPS